MFQWLLNTILSYVLQFILIGFGIKCRTCGEAEILQTLTSDTFFGGRCKNESDLWIGEQICPWEEDTFCFKWQVALEDGLRKKLEIMEAYLSNKKQLETLSNQTRNAIGHDLERTRELR